MPWSHSHRQMSGPVQVAVVATAVAEEEEEEGAVVLEEGAGAETGL